jgi:hypothetical protein
MLYNLEVEEIDLELSRALNCPVTMAVWYRPFYPEREETWSGAPLPLGRCTAPYVWCQV